MNLVLSGRAVREVLDAIEDLSKPKRMISLHADAQRLLGVGDHEATRVAVAALCDAASVDHAYVDDEIRFDDCKLLAMDMDSTLITIECIDEIADFVGKKDEVAAITDAAMRGEIKDFAESLRRRVALLAGTRVTVLDQVFEERLRLSPGAEKLLDAAREVGMFTLLLSGGFTYFASRLKNDLRLSDAYANTLEFKHDRLTGRVVEPILDDAGKREAVENAMRRLDCGPTQAIVIGDGANDIPMMRASANSIAYHAKPATNAVARWRIRYGTLATVLDYLR